MQFIIRLKKSYWLGLAGLMLLATGTSVQARDIEPHFYYQLRTPCILCFGDAPYNAPQNTAEAVYAVILQNAPAYTAAHPELVPPQQAPIYQELFIPDGDQTTNGRHNTYYWHWVTQVSIANNLPPILEESGIILHAECPAYFQLKFDVVVPYQSNRAYCVMLDPAEPDCDSCNNPPKAGNPILPSTGLKQQIETDYQGGSGNTLRFTRTYRSDRNTWSNNYAVTGIDYANIQANLNAINGVWPDNACYPGFGTTTGQSWCFHYMANADQSGVALANDFAVQRGADRILNFGTATSLAPAA
ncbi:hypothetical protein, partial [Andreprevotia chitinilytica]|uniref:hypothetical protein n=1 Tax=Andreprevotia chitinilytica TaxID=396808 RepID=UPI001B80845A